MKIFDEGIIGANTPDPQQVNLCEQWLKKYARPARVRKDDTIHSYWLKHIIERNVGQYVTNGATIQAAANLGYDYLPQGMGPNVFLYMRLILPEDGWRRVRSQGFTQWLFKSGKGYALRDDAINDPDWPRQGKDFGDFYTYLEPYGDSVLDEFLYFWERYTGERAYKREEFPIDEVLFAEAVTSDGVYVINYDPELGSFPAVPRAEKGHTYLYALCDEITPHDVAQVRYIGQTIDPCKRLEQHIMQPGNLDKLDWIVGLRAENQFPVMVVFDTVPSNEANNKERYAIFYFSWAATRPGENWRDTLLNKAHAS